MRAEGVEQTFTIRQRPVAHGDLVVQGRVHTPLVAAPVVDQHAAILFSDLAGAPARPSG